MKETLKIGKFDVELRADGATPFLYKQAFKKDLIKIFSEAFNTGDVGIAGDIGPELGFVMAQQAASPDPLHVDLSQGTFFNWLAQFEPMDLINSAMDIINIYLSTYETDSTAKKKDEHQTEN